MVRHEHRRYPQPHLRGTPDLHVTSPAPPLAVRPGVRVLLPAQRVTPQPGRCAYCWQPLAPGRYLLCPACVTHLGSYTTYHYALRANQQVLAEVLARQEQLDAALPPAA
jgi:hypothetical protein